MKLFQCGRICYCHITTSAYASTQPHAYAYGGAAQLEVGSLPVMMMICVSWPSALHCYPCLTHCSPSNVPNPTPGPLMSTPLINTGQPTLYTHSYQFLFVFVFL